jgi:hypothetical protein
MNRPQLRAIELNIMQVKTVKLHRKSSIAVCGIPGLSKDESLIGYITELRLEPAIRCI